MGDVIKGLFGGGAKPQMPPPPPPPPQLPDASGAATAQRQAAAGYAGVQSTIATSPTGVSGPTNTTGGGKQLTGQ